MTHRNFNAAVRMLAALAAGAACAFAGLATAQDYPAKPIRFIVPVPPGAGPDVDMRQIGARLGQLLGQSVVIENRPGAAGRIATEAVVKSAPDGYSFLVGTPTALVTGPFLYSNLPYDAKRDLAPVSLVSLTHYALTINAQVPASNVAGFIALAKSNPQYSNAGTLGLGAATHLAGEWFANLSGTPLKFIHYNTSTPFNDLMSGQISAIFEALLPVMGNIKAGRLKVLAVTGKQRHALFPDTPTFAESGYAAYDPVVWIGVLAPSATPKAMINKVSAAIAQVARQPEIIAQRRDTVSDSVGSTPEEYGAFLDAERAKWGAVIKQTGVRIE